MRPLIVVGFIAIAVILAILSYIRAWKRREAMAAVAAKLGLRLLPPRIGILPGVIAFWKSYERAQIVTHSTFYPVATKGTICSSIGKTVDYQYYNG